MTYIYAHFFSNGDKYLGISNNPEQRWKEGFNPNNSRQYNHKVLIANEKYDKISLIISENLPKRIAETMEATLIKKFNLNIKAEIRPNLHGNKVICMYAENFSHVYPKIDGEILYHSPEIEEKNNQKIELLERKEKERIEKIEKEKKEREEREKIEKERKKRERLERIEREKKEKIEREIIEKEERRKKGVDLSKIIKNNKKGQVDLAKILKNNDK